MLFYSNDNRCAEKSAWFLFFLVTSFSLFSRQKKREKEVQIQNKAKTYFIKQYINTWDTKVLIIHFMKSDFCPLFRVQLKINPHQEHYWLVNSSSVLSSPVGEVNPDFILLIKFPLPTGEEIFQYEKFILNIRKIGEGITSRKNETKLTPHRKI